MSRMKYEMPWCFGTLGIGARQQHAEVGDRAEAGPDLLAVDDVVVAVLQL